MPSTSQLRGVRILLVEDDDDARELLADALRLYGADVRSVPTGELAVSEAARWAPDVVVSDLALPGVDGAMALARIREQHDCPAIALSGRATAHDRTYSLAAGFVKHLVKPARVSDIVAAIDVVRVRARSESESELRSIVTSLNEQSTCRYTSILRFAEDDTLVSVWTHDRLAPDADPFPVGLPIEASYCRLIQRDGRTCTIENAQTDPRVTDHPKRDELACYVGVPIWTDRLFGTLCSYDSEPQPISHVVRELHETAARRLATILARLFETGEPGGGVEFLLHA